MPSGTIVHMTSSGVLCVGPSVERVCPLRWRYMTTNASMTAMTRKKKKAMTYSRM